MARAWDLGVVYFSELLLLSVLELEYVFNRRQNRILSL